MPCALASLFWVSFLVCILSARRCCPLMSSMSNPDLLPTLQKALAPSVVESYDIRQTIVQGNAIGYKVDVKYSKADTNDKSAYPSQVFVKRVQAVEFVDQKKDWNDLRRTLLYIRTECRFYQMNLQLPSPKVFLSEYDMGSWIAEEALATDTAGSPPVADWKAGVRQEPRLGGELVLEYIPEQTYFQASPLAIPQAHQTLTAAARLHARAWQDASILEPAAARLSKASFHLSVRNPKELQGLEAAWDHFLEAFADSLDGDNNNSKNWITPRLRNLGRRTQALAEHVSRQVSPTPTSPFATLVHGDYKAMNVFLSRNPKEEAVLVDFASVGLGLGTSDVAMHLHHAMQPDDLDQHEIELVRYYWSMLVSEIKKRRSDSKEDDAVVGSGEENDIYPWPQALLHYKYCVVDYFRFFLGRFYKSATPENMEAKADEPNINLVNRNVAAALRFVRTVDAYLAEIEELLQEQEKRSEL